MNRPAPDDRNRERRRDASKEDDAPPRTPEEQVPAEATPAGGAALSSGPRGSLVGATLDGKYVLRSLRGEGASGQVFAADEMFEGRSRIGSVAVKLLFPRSDAERTAVLGEVQMLAQLQHEHILGYRNSGRIASGPAAGGVFVVTELADSSLQERLDGIDGVPGEALLRCAWQMASGLAHCHSRGVIHRDVKPANVFYFRERDLWKLGDFGVSTLHGTAADSNETAGTPAFMAPEMLDRPAAPASDVYALGATMLCALTGRTPFEAEDLDELIQRLRTESVALPADLPAPWDALFPRLLARDPAQRPSASEVAAILEPLLRGEGAAAPERRSPPHAPADSAPRAAPAESLEEHAPPAFAGRVLTVSRTEAADCRSIMEALRLAGDGDRIVVREGRYAENVVIDRAVEIGGEGRRHAIVVAPAEGCALSVAASGASLRGITFEGAGSGPQTCAADVSATCTLADCEVRDAVLSGVVVRGDGTKLRLTNVEIRNCGEAGLFVLDGAEAIAVRCLIVGHGGGLVVASGSARVGLKECRLRRGRASGVCIHGGSAASLLGGDVTGNAGAGVFVGAGGAFRASKCRFDSNRACGLRAGEEARQIEVASCEFRYNAPEAWIAPARFSGGLLQNRVVARPRDEVAASGAAAHP